MKKSKVSILKDLLLANTVSYRQGEYLARWGFFYTYGKTPEYYEEKVKKLIPGAKIIDSKQVWKDFRGGAKTAQSSHFAVKFSIDETIPAVQESL